ncbi:MAG: hypothetical protein KAG84_08075 [Bacteroidales bacterium]|nr:hypothetical protein [Bacteroidales bacterium]
MKKHIFIILLSLFGSYTINAQDSLRYYFDDGGLSNIKNTISIELLDVLDGTITIDYHRVTGKKTSIGFGGSYSFGAGLPNEFALVTSFSAGFLNDRTGFYSHSHLMPSNTGYELWLNIEISKFADRRRSFNLQPGVLYYGNSNENFKSIFLGINYGWRLINAERMFVKFEFQSRAHLYSFLENEEVFGDLSLGLGLILGIKY